MSIGAYNVGVFSVLSFVEIFDRKHKIRLINTCCPDVAIRSRIFSRHRFLSPSWVVKDPNLVIILLNSKQLGIWSDVEFETQKSPHNTSAAADLKVKTLVTLTSPHLKALWSMKILFQSTIVASMDGLHRKKQFVYFFLTFWTLNTRWSLLNSCYLHPVTQNLF